MTFILNLETSTTVCSVSVSGDGRILAFREQADAKSHASQLIPFISDALDEAGINPHNLSAVAVSRGPGSYTGLRIGVSTAKGIAYALGIPIIAIDTLFSMASGFVESFPELLHNKNSLLCPMIDARRMEVYSAIYNYQLNEIRNIRAEIIDENSFLALLNDSIIHFFGDGALKCSGKIHCNSAFFHPDFHPSSKYLAKLSFESFKKKKFVDLAYFEPFYLKDFIATVPVNKMA